VIYLRNKQAVLDYSTRTRRNNASFDAPKVRPEDSATATIEALLAGREQVLADKTNQEIRAALDADPQALDRQMHQLWGARRI
jgi:hypothetical protein